MNDERNDERATEPRGLPDDEPPRDLRKRTKAFALRVIRLYTSLPKHGPASAIGHQLLRRGTSVGAHYCEAYRPRSRAEFISKIEGGLQELEETNYWIELLMDGGIVPVHRLSQLREELRELIAIFSASVLTAKKQKPRP